MEPPNSVRQDHDIATVLILYGASCRSILGAADFHAHYPNFRDKARQGAASNRLHAVGGGLRG
jgi:hypothetical protein